MLAVLCSDPRAHAPQPEAQILTRIVEAYDWSAKNFGNFGQPFFSDELSLRDFFAESCENFIKAARDKLSPSGLLVLKHPALLRVLDSFQRLMPAARVITMLRDPRDQIASELEVAKRSGKSQTVPFLAARLMSFFENTTGIDDTVVVRYEDLVRDFRSVVARLERELGVKITFDPTRRWPDMSGLESFKAWPASTPKYGCPIDPKGVGRYKRDLDGGEIRIIETICEDLMSRFKYPRETHSS